MYPNTICKSGEPVRRARSSSISVVSYYAEDMDILGDTIKQITDRLKGSTRVIIYSKGDWDHARLEELLELADEVVPLKNVGREGETYLVS